MQAVVLQLIFLTEARYNVSQELQRSPGIDLPQNDTCSRYHDTVDELTCRIYLIR